MNWWIFHENQFKYLSNFIQLCGSNIFAAHWIFLFLNLIWYCFYYSINWCNKSNSLHFLWNAWHWYFGQWKLFTCHCALLMSNDKDEAKLWHVLITIYYICLCNDFLLRIEMCNYLIHHCELQWAPLRWINACNKFEKVRKMSPSSLMSLQFIASIFFFSHPEFSYNVHLPHVMVIMAMYIYIRWQFPPENVVNNTLCKG